MKPRDRHSLGPPTLKDSIRVPKPKWPDGRPALAVAYSGGGFRASLAGIGVTRGLADLGLLGDVRYTSSVSGGSWANALLALNWEALEMRDFSVEAVDDLIVRPFVERITTTSLSLRMKLNLWRVLGPRTRTDLLADAFDDWFGHEAKLGDLNNDCRFMFNATNLNSGRRFGFEAGRVGDYKAKYIDGRQIRLADALAASAAIPGALAAMRVRRPNDVYPKSDRPYLVDGAVYDNLGIEPFNHIRERPLIVMLDAGGHLEEGTVGKRRLMTSVSRSLAVVQRQGTTVRRRWFIEGLRSWEDWEANHPEEYAAYTGNQVEANKEMASWVYRVSRGKTEEGEVPPPMPPRNSKRGVTFGLKTSMDPKDGDLESMTSKHQQYDIDDTHPPEVPPWRQGHKTAEQFRLHTAAMPMSAGKFAVENCRDLIYRGWWLTRESIRTFHPDVLRSEPPAWRDWYQQP